MSNNTADTRAVIRPANVNQITTLQGISGVLPLTGPPGDGKFQQGSKQSRRCNPLTQLIPVVVSRTQTGRVDSIKARRATLSPTTPGIFASKVSANSILDTQCSDSHSNLLTTSFDPLARTSFTRVVEDLFAWLRCAMEIRQLLSILVLWSSGEKL